MAPYLILFGRGVPTYGLLALLGAGAAWVYFHRRLRARGENPGRAEQAFLWGALGAVAGGKVLYLLPRLPQLTADLPLLAQDPAAFAARYLTGGFVFYGGLLGALGAVWGFCRRRKAPFGPLARDLVPAIPLFHAFGRVGCFLAGCCYGIPAPAGGWGGGLSPQPGGAPGCRCSCMRPPGAWSSSSCWTAWPAGAGGGRSCWRSTWPSTGPCGFSLEFLRGDGARGFWGALSTSQWVAVVTVAAALLWMGRQTRRRGT